MARVTLVLLVLALLCACSSVWAIRGFQIKVEPKVEDCFYRDFEAGTKIDFEWHVIDGGLLDVDVRVFQGRSKFYSKLYFEGRDTNKYSFVAAVSGPYGFCFNNEMSRFTVKTVSFTIDDDGALDAARPEDLSPFEQAIGRIKSSLHTIEQEQSYYRVREHVHRNTAESTNTRVYTWSMVESVILLVMSIGQILYLRRLFSEDKRSGQFV